MNSVALRTSILWIHALAGGAWIIASIAVLFVAGAMGIEDPEGRALIRRAGPLVNRIGFGAIATLLVTGIANVFIAGAERHYQFSPQFIAVFAAKGIIFIALFLVLGAAVRTEARLYEQDPGIARRLLILNGVVAALGATALGLGLWLMGS